VLNVVDSKFILSIMRTSSLPRQPLFNNIDEQLTSVGAWFIWSFASFGMWDDFKNK
jgi:hypothetical protein